MHGCILDLGRGEDAVAQAAVQRALGDQVRLAPAQRLGKLSLNFVQREEAGDLAGFELDEHVHVAVRTEVRTKHRPEQEQYPACPKSKKSMNRRSASSGPSFRIGWSQ